MSLEIRELIIKASVNNEGGGGSSGNKGGGNSEEAKINEVVSRVLEIIKEKSER